LLLNTDLHVADLTTRMSRSQFVRNTLTAIQMQLQPTPAQSSATDLTHDSNTPSETEAVPTIRSKRSDSITSWHSVSREAAAPPTSYVMSPAANGSTPSVQISAASHDHRSSVSSIVYGRGWENEMENLLKVRAMQWRICFSLTL
jgi:PH/SEC7 domain-containing protein